MVVKEKHRRKRVSLHYSEKISRILLSRFSSRKTNKQIKSLKCWANELLKLFKIWATILRRHNQQNTATEKKKLKLSQGCAVMAARMCCKYFSSQKAVFEEKQCSSNPETFKNSRVERQRVLCWPGSSGTRDLVLAVWCRLSNITILHLNIYPTNLIIYIYIKNVCVCV